MTSPEERAEARIVDGTAWNELCDRLREAGGVVQRGPSDPLTRAEGYRYLTRLLRAGLETFVEHADPLAPTLRRPVHETIKMGNDNPDNHYFHASISGAYEYVLRGKRNSVHYLAFATQIGHYGQGRGMPPTGHLDARDLVLEPDGSFEIVLACERPRGAKNFLSMKPETGSLIVRQSRLDPRSEVLAELSITRTTGPRAESTLTPVLLDTGLSSTTMLMQGASMLFSHWAEGFKAHVNQLPRFDQALSNAMGGVPDIAYYHSYWSLKDDEALVIDVMPPPCDHWNFQLSNHWLESLDYRVHSIHLNTKTGAVRPDGSVRIVVAHRDPGVSGPNDRLAAPGALPFNWLETAGHSFGSMCFRWVRPEVDSPPTPRTRVVSVDEVRGLP